ncbi:MAG: acyl-ACP--UDP-N-acetylglucosamine O-acyltransferase [Synergistales bacterium]|nr:acyl-ACP--UDP-N-acetylglucosamine O-acyltransferase [Synergistales bacterium]
MTVEVHPSALVSAQAELADGVSIGPYAVVDGHVRIGAGTRIEAFVRICGHVTIGRGCRIFEHATIGREPQDLDFRGESSRVIIGDSVIVRENATIHRACGEGNSTTIGDGAMVMEGVHVGHNCTIGDRATLVNKVGLAGYVAVGPGAVLGGMSGVHQFVRVGRLCMVGGLSKLVKDVPPFTLIDGHPGRIYGINRVGLKRQGYSSASRDAIRRFYRRLSTSPLPMRRAVAELDTAEARADQSLREILDFFGSSTRGMTPWVGRGRKRDRDDG